MASLLLKTDSADVWMTTWFHSPRSCTEDPAARRGFVNGHFCPEPHTSLRLGVLYHIPISETINIPTGTVTRRLAQWLSPGQVKPVFLPGWKSLIHICFYSSDRVDCLCSTQAKYRYLNIILLTNISFSYILCFIGISPETTKWKIQEFIYNLEKKLLWGIN